MTLETSFETIELSALRQTAQSLSSDGWRGVQMLCVNTENGIDLTYSFMKEALLKNIQVKSVSKDNEVPSLQDLFPGLFPFENEAVDLFGVKVTGMALDFAGKFYQLSQSEPMTIISAEKKAAAEKAAKIAAAKAAKAAKGTAAAPAQPNMDEKLAGMDPEKAAKVRAAMEAKAKRDAAKAAAKDGE